MTATFPNTLFITEGKVADVKVAQQLDFAPGTIVVDDRGYTDDTLSGRWCSQQVYLVTRMKDNALYEAIGDREVPQHRHVLKDGQIELRGLKAIEKYPLLKTGFKLLTCSQWNSSHSQPPSDGIELNL